MSVSFNLMSIHVFSDLHKALRGFNRENDFPEWCLHYTLCIVYILILLKRSRIWPPVCLDRNAKKKITGFKVNVVAFEELCFSPSAPSRCCLSLTSLHLSFHLLLFSVSHNPKSLLQARKLQLKLSQSGAQLRLPGDLKGKKTRDWLWTKPLIHTLFICTNNFLRLSSFMRLQLATVHTDWLWLWNMHERIHQAGQFDILFCVIGALHQFNLSGFTEGAFL